jgi:GNAT superfamily N-acetyltransferase
MEIRPALPQDGPAIVDLIRCLAEFEKLTPPDAAAGERLLHDAFVRQPPRLELWVAEAEGGQVVAYAACFECYSTFLALPTFFLEDLFVHPSARRRGIARRMLTLLRDEAERRGCGRFEWSVLDWNEDAKKLYRSVGAEIHGNWEICRVELRGR